MNIRMDDYEIGMRIKFMVEQRVVSTPHIGRLFLLSRDEPVVVPTIGGMVDGRRIKTIHMQG